MHHPQRIDYHARREPLPRAHLDPCWLRKAEGGHASVKCSDDAAVAKEAALRGREAELREPRDEGAALGPDGEVEAGGPGADEERLLKGGEGALGVGRVGPRKNACGEALVVAGRLAEARAEVRVRLLLRQQGELRAPR